MDIQDISVGDYIVPSKDREYLGVTANKLYKITSVMKNTDKKVYEVWFVNDNEKKQWVNVSQFTNSSWKIQPGLDKDNPKYKKMILPFKETIATVAPLEMIDVALDLKSEQLFEEYWKLEFEGDK